MKPNQICKYVIPLCLCLAIRCLADAPALPLAEKVPDDALLYAGWAGSASLQQSYDSSHLKAVLDASNFPDVIAQLIPQLMNKVHEPDAKKGFITAQKLAAILWAHPTAFYLHDIGPTGAAEPQLRPVLLCDAGSDSAALIDLLHQVFTSNGNNDIAIGSAATLVWICAPDDHPGSPASALNASAAFTSVMNRLQPSPALAIYIDVRSGLAKVDAATARDADAKRVWPAVRDALGLTNISAVAITTGFDGADWVSSACLMAPAPRTGLLAAIEPAAPDPALLARVPESANLVSATRFDAGKFLDSIGAAFAADPDASKAFHMGLGAANMFLGRNLRQQIIGSLGDQWISYCNSPTSFVFMNKPTNPAAASDALTSAAFGICNALNLRFSQPGVPLLTLDQQTIQGISITSAAAGTLKPSMAISGGILYIAESPQAIIAAVTSPDSAQPDITLRPEFASALKRLSVPAVKGFDYINLPKSTPASYALLAAALNGVRAFAPLAQLQVPPITLPPLDQLVANVSPSVGVNWADDNGIYSKEISPFPGSGVLGNSSAEIGAVGATAMTVSILLPSLNRARETANRVKCASNERQIGQAILLYANDNRGKYPPDLGTLLKTEDITAQVFVCPSGNNEVPANLNTPDQLAQWVNDHGDYVYVGKGLTTQSARADQIVLYEKPDSHSGDGMNMLYGDGHVEFQRMDRAKQLIQQQQNGEVGPPGEHGL